MGKQGKKRGRGGEQSALPRRVFEQNYKVEVAKRLLAGESGSKLSRELKIWRSVLRVKRVTRITGTTATTIYVYDAFGKLAAEYSTQAPAESGTFYRTTDHLRKSGDSR